MAGLLLSGNKPMKKDAAWIDLLKIVLTVGIVVRHASLPDWFDKGYATFDLIGKGLVGLTETCVPLFFVLSGFLFFRGVPKKPQASWFGNKWKRRLNSLLIPYLIANCLALAFYIAARKLSPGMVSGFLGEDWKNPLFIFWTGPINLSLWFIRELIVVCLLSPLVWLAVRYTWGVAVIAAGILWGFGIAPAPLFFFSLGAVAPILEIHSKRLEQWQERHPLRIDPSWRAWCFFIYLYHYLPLVGTKKVLVSWLHPQSSTMLLAIWLGSAALALAALTALYFGMRKGMPRLLSVLVGGK